MRSLTLFAIMAIAISGCAAKPEEIAAADIGSGNYTSHSCAQLAERQSHYSQLLENLSAQQRSARSADTVGVILLGLPLSSMSGNDRETEIAVSRGHLQAIETARAARRCD